ncbi:MAG: hypothetical protein ACJASQ_001429 [Crocinitomicaceae bacterium]|jgi:hypothetical protein
MRTYKGIRDAVIAKGYQFFTGDLKLNFVWERTDDIITNKFTDLLHVVYTEQGKEKVITIPATTKPGIKGSTDSPVTVGGVTGTAIIVPGQYLNAWTFKDTFKEFSSYPYFRQYGKIDYWRDFNKDTKVDRVQFQDDRLFGTHWHKMSNVGTYGSGLINNWSLGCMGAAEPQFKKILPIVRAAVVVHGKTFTGTIMESVDFGTSAGTVSNETKTTIASAPKTTSTNYNFNAQNTVLVVSAKSGLSLRRGAPNTQTSKVRTIPFNTILNAVGYVTNGESVGGKSIWYKDSSGNYFWGGGVVVKSTSAPSSASTAAPTGSSTPKSDGVIGQVECITEGLRLRSTPDTKHSYVGTVPKGTILKYVSVVNNGQSVGGNSKWYKSDHGLYFWSGGVK